MGSAGQARRSPQSLTGLKRMLGMLFFEELSNCSSFFPRLRPHTSADGWPLD